MTSQQPGGGISAPQIEFLLKEFEALRAEILATQRRAFQTMTAGVVGLPAVAYLIQMNAERPRGPALTPHRDPYVNLFMMVLPVVVIVIALLYLADNNAVIRAGYFIRLHIESYLAPPGAGWEQWLEDGKPTTRKTERNVTNAVYILFLLYYGVAVYLAWPAERQMLGMNGAKTITASLILFGIAVAAYFVRALHLTTVMLEKDIELARHAADTRNAVRRSRGRYEHARDRHGAEAAETHGRPSPESHGAE